MNYKEIKENELINAYIRKGNEKLGALGFTDHSNIHAVVVAENAGMILEKLGYGEHEIALAKMTGYMHDIGNMINRKNHAEYGGLLAERFLENTDIPMEDRIEIVACISNHDEGTGGAFDPISAAVILADKSDVRRNRVRKEKKKADFDLHDRVNFAVTKAGISVDIEKHAISLELEIDEEICSICDYFEIFLVRMMMCKKAAEILGCRFRILVNGNKIL